MFGGTVHIYQALHALSILCALLTIGIVVAIAIKDPAVARRPTIRISAWMAATNIIVALTYLTRLSQPVREQSGHDKIAFRVLIWMHMSMYLAFTFLATCITTHLMLIALLHRHRLAARLDRYYEVISFSLALGISALSFVFYKDVVWDPAHLDLAVTATGMPTAAALMLSEFVWEIPCIGFCAVAGGLVAMRLKLILLRIQSADLAATNNARNDPGPAASSVGAGHDGRGPERGHRPTATLNCTPLLAIDPCSRSLPARPFSDPLVMPACFLWRSLPTTLGAAVRPLSAAVPVGKPGAGAGFASHISNRHHRHIQRSLLCIVLYPLHLIIWRVPYILILTLQLSHVLGHATNIIVSLQAIACFAIFLINPSVDQHFFPWFAQQLRRSLELCSRNRV